MDLNLTTLDISKTGDLALPERLGKVKRMQNTPPKTAHNLVVRSVKIWEYSFVKQCFFIWQLT
jgi:hypothetical protein